MPSPIYRIGFGLPSGHRKSYESTAPRGPEVLRYREATHRAADWKRGSTVSTQMWCIPSRLKCIQDRLVAHYPPGGGRQDAQGEAVGFLSIHGVHCFLGNDHPEVPIGSVESGAEDTGGSVDPGQNHRVGLETAAKEKFQVGGKEGAVPLLFSHHQVALLVEFGNNLGPRTSCQVVAQDPLAGLDRIIVDCLPERV